MAVDIRVPLAGVATRIGGGRWAALDVVAVFGVALALRLGMVLYSHGGMWGNFGYDGSVYYAAADALTFGRMPYQDFVLLHPPGLMLVLVPFALLGRLVGDHAGFVAATCACEILGAINAVLVVSVSRRAGLARPAALLGGLFYAVWSGAVGAEYSVRLEPVGSFAFLCAVLALFGSRAGRTRELLLAGAALGFAVSTKIWWIVPTVIVLVWQWRSRRRRAGVVAGGFAAAIIVVNGVFFVDAPSAMWRRVVLDQVGRTRSSQTLRQRVEQLTSLRSALQHVDPGIAVAVLVGVAAVVGFACMAAWGVRACRVVVVVLVAQLVVLVTAPSFFSYYSGYAAAAAALVLAAATHQGLGGHGVRASRAIVAGVVLAAGLTSAGQAAYTRTAVARFPGTRLAAAVRNSRCVMSDSPMALIELDALSRGFANGCQDWVDVTGRTYDIDRSARLSRVQNPRWQRDLRRYLLSGDAVVLIRAGTGIAPATRRAVDAHPVLGSAHGFAVRRVGPAGSRVDVRTEVDLGTR